MTAKELIEVLKQADENATVIFCSERLLPHNVIDAEVCEYNGKERNAVFIR